MSDEPREEAAPAPPPPPTIGVDRVEFRRALNDTNRQVEAVQRTFLAAWEEAGIVLLSLGLWALVTGWLMFREAARR